MGPARLFPLLLAALLPAERASPQGAPASAAGGGGSSGAPSAPRPGAYGVKLCGRDFIRAVIFTCGGSRWRRITEEEPPPPPPPPSRNPLARADLLQASSDKEAENIKLQLLLDPELEQLQSASQQTGRQPLKDLFQPLHEAYNEYIPISNNLEEYIHQLEDATHKVQSESWSLSSVGSDNLPWVIKHPRRKRDLTMGVARMCCNWGCTKAEISALC